MGIRAHKRARSYPFPNRAEKKKKKKKGMQEEIINVSHGSVSFMIIY